jgi:hypothetical protein
LVEEWFPKSQDAPVGLNTFSYQKRDAAEAAF